MAMDQIAPGLVRCIERVPRDGQVGMHLCHGDYGHQHFKQPKSLQMQVDLVNAVTSAARDLPRPGQTAAPGPRPARPPDARLRPSVPGAPSLDRAFASQERVMREMSTATSRGSGTS
jgi:hypothetical protein